jgi:hypothetical protein
MGNDPVNNVDPSGGSILSGITGVSNIFFNTATAAIGGAMVDGIVGMFNGDENAWKKGAAIGAGLGLLDGAIAAPLNPNFYIGPTWSMVKDDAGSGSIFKSAYFGSYVKSIVMEVLSLGKIVTVRGNSEISINQKVNNYFTKHPNASKIDNLTVEFHSGYYGDDFLSENSFTSISSHLNSNSTILLGNCFAGSASYISNISTVANGATVIGHEGYQNDLSFLLNGSLTGANPNVMGSGHLNNQMFKHTIVKNGIAKTGILLTTHVSNGGKITVNQLSSSRVSKILSKWKSVKSRFMMFLGALFNFRNL